MVEKEATCMQGAANPGGVDSIVPPWAAYRAIVVGHLIALDKCPGVCPVGVGEILLSLMHKCVIAVCGKDVTDACSTQQLCAGLRARIEGAIHSMNLLWEDHGEETNWGILLVDTQNAFNKVNRRAMLWNVRHSWAAGSCFVFNTYHHWQKLVLCGHEKLVMSKEGVMQGYPLQ
eukprot:6010806-Ditylum_brightwellii.AAC.1